MSHGFFCRLFFGLAIFVCPAAQAQTTSPGFWQQFNSNSQWWRSCASLDLDFLNDRYYVNNNTTCNGTVGTTYTAGGGKTGVQNFITGIGATFTRNSIGTYFNSSGVLTTASANVPRLDHDPVTFAPKGILFEPSRANLLSYSSDFTQSVWSKGNSNITANATMAPDGTSTAAKLVENANNINHWATQTSTVTSGTSYTYSIFLKAAERTQAEIQLYAGSGVNLYPVVNLLTGVVVAADGATVTSQSLSNGWWRFSFSATTQTTTLSFYVYPAVAGSNVYSGNGSSGIYVWGPQLEQASEYTSPTSYIPTSGSAVTRTADTLSIPTSTWLNASAGTLLVQQEFWSGVEDYNPMMGTAEANSVGVQDQGPFGGHVCAFINGSCRVAGGAFTSGFNKIAVTYSGSAVAFSINGSAAGTGAADTITSPTTLWLGRDFNNFSVAAKHVTRLTYFPIQQPNYSLPDFTR